MSTQALVDEFASWCAENGMPESSGASDLLSMAEKGLITLTAEQRTWLEDMDARWAAEK